MLPGKSPIPSDPIDAVYALVVLIVLLYMLAATSGCAGFEKQSGDEPLWKPHAYLYSPDSAGRCAFVNKTGHVIECDEPLIHDYYLAPLEDLVTLKSKLQQCETWR